MLSRKKLEYLYRMNERGFPAMFAFECKGGEVCFAMIVGLVAGKDKWIKASPEQMSTTDHGNKKRGVIDDGYILPLDLFTRIK